LGPVGLANTLNPVDERVTLSSVFFSQLVEGNAIGTSPARRQQAHASCWHLIHVERALTWCGLDIGYGHPQRQWSETHKDRRCQICVERLGRATRIQAS